ncbi:MAG: CDP-diacylglycerol--serine O-phosphatidyltransferase [Gemmatales bacterium]|nr:MAG: CDP-diacylglycerol--serine O-phosphatidyltransferase [Gemmatales bacterium]
MKKIAIIPTLLTLANAVCGFAAIAYASRINFTQATEYYFAVSGWLIVAAMLFDVFDGYVARLSRTASKFGGELDSLCDAVSFGLAPAFILLKMGPGWEPRAFLHQFLAGIAALYLVCTLLRLARFNVENSPDPSAHKRFRGLPSPAAAGCIASLAIFRGTLISWSSLDSSYVLNIIEAWATLGALAVALLMVSQVPYPHFSKKFLDPVLYRRRHFQHLIQLVLLVFLIVTTRELALIVGFWLYAIGIPVRYAILRSLKPRAVPTPAGIEKLSK